MAWKLINTMRLVRAGSPMPQADQIASEYRQLRDSAPRREQPYFVDHRGVTSSGDSSNRFEEHLAVGLFNASLDGRRLALPGDGSLRLLDYQFPLKARRGDVGIGKIDLLGLLDDGAVAVIELKAHFGSDRPAVALLEVLTYAAVVQANSHRIEREFFGKFEILAKADRPHLIVMAPDTYWREWRGSATGSVIDMAAVLARDLDLSISLLSLKDADCVLGLNGNPPIVRGHLLLSAIEGQAMPPFPVAAPNNDSDVYSRKLLVGFWTYRDSHSPDPGRYDTASRSSTRPPVFLAGNDNLLVPPGASPEIVSAIHGAIPSGGRHRHFGSMRSSQALAQSVFGGLRALGRIDAVAGLAAEDGWPAFFASADGLSVTLEHRVTTLGERENHETQVDVWFDGPLRVVVECKLSEERFGPCSRPERDSADPGHCSGDYTAQQGRRERCPLTEIGIRYWRHVPNLFDWAADRDHSPCPLRAPYQLVRNVLAACLEADSSLNVERGHALVLYDARNPAFHPGGMADRDWLAVVRSLRHPRTLRRVSWQKLAAHLAAQPDLSWLSDGLAAKYGIDPASPPSPEKRVSL